MNQIIFVGNLPFAISESTIRVVFGKIGAIDSIKMNIKDGHFTGWAYVTMADTATAEHAVMQWKFAPGMTVKGEMQEIEGKQILVATEQTGWWADSSQD